MPRPTRAQSLMLAVLVVIGAGVALVPLRAEQIHRYGFGGKNTVLVRGDANVKVEEKEHDISDQSFKSQPTSEHLKLTADVAAGDSAFIHYHYDTPIAPVSAAATATRPLAESPSAVAAQASTSSGRAAVTAASAVQSESRR